MHNSFYSGSQKGTKQTQRWEISAGQEIQETWSRARGCQLNPKTRGDWSHCGGGGCTVCKNTGSNYSTQHRPEILCCCGQTGLGAKTHLFLPKQLDLQQDGSTWATGVSIRCSQTDVPADWRTARLRETVLTEHKGPGNWWRWTHEVHHSSYSCSEQVQFNNIQMKTSVLFVCSVWRLDAK